MELETSVILVDDHALFRDGIRRALEGVSTPLSIVAEFGTGREFLNFFDRNPIADLLFLDIILPDISGIEIAKYMKNTYPDVKIIMLSSEVSVSIVTQLLEINVDGYLSKMAQKDDINKAVCTVLSGEHYYGQSVMQIVHDVYIAKKYEQKGTWIGQRERHKKIFGKKQKEILTPRELEIVRKLCDGFQAKEVAQQLNISVRTVEAHKSNILKKLGFNNIVELVRYAIKCGIVEL